MTRSERSLVREMESILREAQHVLADWLEPGVLSAGEAQERLLELLDNRQLVSALAKARWAVEEQMEVPADA